MGTEPLFNSGGAVLPERVTVYGPALRDLLVRVDSVCSLAAHRGIDSETREELIAVSRIARAMYERSR